MADPGSTPRKIATLAAFIKSSSNQHFKPARKPARLAQSTRKGAKASGKSWHQIDASDRISTL
jgi:hypothetical protein